MVATGEVSREIDKYVEGEKIGENVYLNLGDGYMSAYTCQNSLRCTVRFVYFIVCTSTKK